MTTGIWSFVFFILAVAFMLSDWEMGTYVCGIASLALLLSAMYL